MTTDTQNASASQTSQNGQAPEPTREPYAFITVVDCFQGRLRIILSYHDGEKGGIALMAWNPHTSPDQASIHPGGSGFIPNGIVQSAYTTIPIAIMEAKTEEHKQLSDFVGLQVMDLSLEEAIVTYDNIPF
jgi:hypothetical protein